MPEATAAGRARQGLIVLTLINLFNYLDRFVVPSLLESIKKSELHPSDTQLFSLVPAFTVVYMLAAPVFGPLGDRRARPPLIALGVLIWSVATALGGFARSYATLFLARATVGVGEAAYGRSEEHTSELQSPCNLVCRLLLEKKKKTSDALASAH